MGEVRAVRAVVLLYAEDGSCIGFDMADPAVQVDRDVELHDWWDRKWRESVQIPVTTTVTVSLSSRAVSQIVRDAPSVPGIEKGMGA